MYKKLILLTCFVLVLPLAGNALAMHWDGGAGPNDPNWNVAINWDPNTVPTSSDDAMAVAVPGYGPTVDNPGATAASVYVGIWGIAGELTVTSSGSLSVASSLIVADDAGNTGVVSNEGSINAGGGMYVGQRGTGTATNTGTITTGDLVIGHIAESTGTLTTDGDIDVSGWMYIGLNGRGLLHIYGGTIDIAGTLDFSTVGTGSSHVDFYGGTVTAGNIILPTDGDSTANFTEGVLITGGDWTEAINWFADVGWWTGYGGRCDLSVDYDVITEKTTVRACPQGDINWDCKVDFLDFAIMADNWLVER